MPAKNKLLWPVLLLCLAAAGGYYWKARGAGQAATDAAGPAGAGAARPGAATQTVTVYTVQQRDVPVTVEVAGTVVALTSVEVRPQLSSTVRAVAVREGQFVRRGDLLFTLDDRNERAALDKARAALLRDQATLADLQRQWTRAQELRTQNFIAQSAADSVKSQLEAQQALVASDQAAVQAAEVALGYASIRAPQAGRVGQIAVNPGSLVQPAGAALLTINQIDPIGVSFAVPEAQLTPLLAAMHGRADEAPRLNVLPGGAGERRRGEPSPTGLAGTLSFVDNAVDTTSGTIRAKGTVPNPREQLWPGQYVSVRLALRTLKDATVVPQAALIQRGAERSVYVVGADSTVQPRVVQIRQPLGELVAVDGVQPGERVVVEGKQNLRPGGAVRITAAAAKGGAAGAASGAAAASAASGAPR